MTIIICAHRITNSGVSIFQDFRFYQAITHGAALTVENASKTPYLIEGGRARGY